MGVEFAGKRRAKWFVKIVFQLKENSLTIVVHGGRTTVWITRITAGRSWGSRRRPVVLRLRSVVAVWMRRVARLLRRRVRVSGWIWRGAAGRREARRLPLPRGHPLPARRQLLVRGTPRALLGRRVTAAVVAAHVLLPAGRHPAGASGAVAVGRVPRRPHPGSVVLRVTGVASGRRTSRPGRSTRAHLVVHHVRWGPHLLRPVGARRPALRSRRRPWRGRPVALGRHARGRRPSLGVGRRLGGTAGRPRGHR